MKLSAYIIPVMLLFPAALSAQTDGSVNYTIKTLPKTGAQFSPKHVLAIWVEDATGTLVKNLELSADRRKQYLYTWNSKSGGTATDITTGATLPNHITHTKTWNCKNKSGILVPDGTYKISTEFTSEHAQGPLNTVSFNKGPGGITLNPASSNYFTDINLKFTPVLATGIEPLTQSSYELEVYPNPVKESLNIAFFLLKPSEVKLSIYTMNMQLVRVIHESIGNAGKNTLSWTPSSDMAKGSYVLVLQSPGFIATRKIIISQ